jgi:hypothetical protein
MTQELYFKQFGKLDKVEGFDDLVHWANYEEAKKGNSCDIIPTGTAAPAQQSIHVAGKKEIGRKAIQLKAFNGKYVCSDENMGSQIIANRDSAQGWETFTLIEFENMECALLSHMNKFFTVEKDGSNMLTATRDVISKLGTFMLVELEDHRVAFKAANGNYLGVDEVTLQLCAKNVSVGEHEKFHLMAK